MQTIIPNGNMQKKAETAIAIGRAILEEYFHINQETVLEAVEKDGIWTVSNVIERQGVREDGTRWVIMGGGVSVSFRRSNGEILAIELAD